PVTIKIGALPNASVKGRLEKIWLKAHKQEQATVFPIEIVLTEVAGATLRAGYSANAEVRSEEHTSELQSRFDLVCRRLLEQNKAGASGKSSEKLRRWEPSPETPEGEAVRAPREFC